jgi:Zn-dependent metalloprotease
MADYANQPGKTFIFSGFSSILTVGLFLFSTTQSWGFDKTTPELADPTNNVLKQTQVLKSPTEIETTKYQHYYKGLEVIGSMIFQHKIKGKVKTRNKISHFDLDTRPTLSAATAASLAQGLAGNLELRKAPVLQILPASKLGQQGSARLIYWVELTGKGQGEDRDILIDAHSGKLIADLDHNFTIAPIQVYSARDQGIEVIPNIEGDSEIEEDSVIKNCKLIDLKSKQTQVISAKSCASVYRGTSHFTDNQCQIVDGSRGFPLGIDTDSCTSVATNDSLLDTSDPDAAKALDNSQKVLNYFQRHFGRNSFDNQGSQLVSLIHAGDQMANAFWNVSSNMMVYGEGDGKELGDFTESVDVAGHEMTHGVTSHTAKLMMMNESGALNEAFSDFFGKQIENQGSWLMGKDLFIGASANRGFRDLARPGSIIGHVLDLDGKVISKHYPAKTLEAAHVAEEQACDKNNDNCWVHFNATIPGHASYLVYQALGAEKAEMLYYTALTQNISASDDFRSAAQAILETCDQLDYSSSECRSVQDAFQEVGMI